MSDHEELYVCVRYDFNYLTDDGKTIFMKEGEEFLLLDKTNDDWWQVIRDSENCPFYAPASYLEVLSFIERKHSNDFNANIGAVKKVKDDERTLESKEQMVYYKKQPNFVYSCRNSYNNSKLNSTNNEVYGLMFNNPLCVDDESSVDNVSERNFYKQEGHDSDSIDENSLDNANDEKLKFQEVEEQENLFKDPTSPIYVNIPLCTTSQPPTPDPKESPIRVLHDQWAEYIDSNGRKYYYNMVSNETTWKPPRRRGSRRSTPTHHKESSLHSEESAEIIPKPPPQKLKPRLSRLTCSHSGSSICSSSESLDSPNTPVTPSDVNSSALPPNWIQECDVETGETYFFNIVTKTRWFCTLDDSGQIYFYEENGSESVWELPDMSITDNSGNTSELSVGPQQDTQPEVEESSSASLLQCEASESHLIPSSPKFRKQKSPPPKLPQHSRSVKTCSAALSAINNGKQSHQGLDEGYWPSFTDKSFVITRQGTLNKAKVMESGRQVRKKWSSSFVVLTDLFLVFYKDIRSCHMNTPGIKPEMCVNLTGALIEWGPDKSSRRNVFQISTVYGHQLLLQDDNAQTTKEWFESIKAVILKLPSGFDMHHGAKENASEKELHKDDIKKGGKLMRSRSAKQYSSKGSIEDLSSGSPSERKKKIRNKLRYFFLRRPTMESLREKGIIIDEPVFGCHLLTLCSREKTTVPKFVVQCIEAIEEKEMTADGLYRASGNLSQIQKIRFHVNQDDYSGLKAEEDVHVLTGALKMFFRDMKEPLFPFTSFNNFLNAISLPDRQSKLKRFQEMVNNLHMTNYSTLRFLLQHLLKVTNYSAQNRMHVQNLAIVFGPTLMWPESESSNIALDMMHQNRIIEFLLLEFKAIFD